MLGLMVHAGAARLSRDLPEPLPAEGETVVEVLRAGICATDLALTRGYMSFSGVPGHEFVGRVLEGPLRGCRVVGEINASCGRCSLCIHGLPRHCPSRTVLGIVGRAGAFADLLSLPTRNLHRVPDSVPTDAAVFVEPLAAAFEILEQVDVSSGMRALVLGDGKLGLLCAMVLTQAGAAVTVSGRHPERAKCFSEHLPEFVPELASDPPPFDLVVEATGQPGGLALALRCVRPRGTVVLKTTTERPAAMDLAPVVIHEILIVGSRCGPFEPALRALERGDFPVERMIEARFPLEHSEQALERARRGGILKILLDVHDE